MSAGVRAVAKTQSAPVAPGLVAASDPTCALSSPVSLPGLAFASQVRGSSDSGHDVIHRCWWWCWGKPKKRYVPLPEAADRETTALSTADLNSGPSLAPQPQLSLEDRFEQAAQGGPPASRRCAAQRTQIFRGLVSAMSPEEKERIRNSELLKKAEICVGPEEYASLLSALDMYTKARDASGVEYSLHMSGREVDGFIEDAMNRKDLAHLRPYFQIAMKASRKCEGYLAVVGDADWAKAYQAFFDDPIGFQDELWTNGYMVAGHRDRVIVLKNDRGNRSAAIHEAMHRFGQEALVQTLGYEFNEGVTEYFSRLLTDRDGNPANLGGPPSTSYQMNWEFVRVLAPMLGHSPIRQQTALAQMYFLGRVDALWRYFDNAYADKNTNPADTSKRWTAFKDAICDGRWSDAVDAMP
jgi:hypothetical protein